MNKKYICLQKCNRVSKNAEFYAYFKSIEKSTKMHAKKVLNEKGTEKAFFQRIRTRH
jgi:hypothetical protein